MMHALKYLPTSTYFISVRLTSSFILLGVGVLFFGDGISTKEAIGFLFGVAAMSLLFEKENSQKYTQYKKGILFLIAGILSLVIGHSITKILSFNLKYIPTILSLTFFSACIFSLAFGWKSIVNYRSEIKGIIKLNLFQAFFFMTYFYLLFYVYHYGDLGISYKIQSYSPFIPIILAALIYREKINFKKSIGIILTIISLYFFT